MMERDKLPAVIDLKSNHRRKINQAHWWYRNGAGSPAFAGIYIIPDGILRREFTGGNYRASAKRSPLPACSTPTVSAMALLIRGTSTSPALCATLSSPGSC